MDVSHTLHIRRTSKDDGLSPSPSRSGAPSTWSVNKWTRLKRRWWWPRQTCRPISAVAHNQHLGTVSSCRAAEGNLWVLGERHGRLFCNATRQQDGGGDDITGDWFKLCVHCFHLVVAGSRDQTAAGETITMAQVNYNAINTRQLEPEQNRRYFGHSQQQNPRKTLRIDHHDHRLKKLFLCHGGGSWGPIKTKYYWGCPQNNKNNKLPNFNRFQFWQPRMASLRFRIPILAEFNSLAAAACLLLPLPGWTVSGLVASVLTEFLSSVLIILRMPLKQQHRPERIKTDKSF